MSCINVPMIQQEAVTFREVAEYHLRGASFGVCDENALQAIDARVPLSAELHTWYLTASPLDVVIPWTIPEYRLYNPLELLDRQYGYRWRYGDAQSKILDGWKANWIVIGDIGADPVIADVKHPLRTTPIFIATHGIGEWVLHEIAPSLAVFLKSHTVWIQVLALSGGSTEIFDEDSEIQPQLLTNFRQRLTTILDDSHRDNLLKFFTS